ncbi:hypothetical protein C7H19_01490 [Aphanothece hegewaldii CCALA 016]|uniref:Uncharacterized protein n=1 Tax=Aphanothece hegewaldii CCALA 016 TaxID=2107694 RepID=A0A2T1M3U1_9CHRO|nr:tetratricopeptide repeat protein [Aphanothece hegewaldii]PSF39488.1 hypothetical protein C7H19_01490 [Aphanothece hegewaldii CCALA 016]
MIASYLSEAIITVEKLLGDSIEYSENWQLACLKLSEILQSMGLFDSSRWWCSSALPELPSLSEIYFSIGELYDFLSESEKAIAAYEKSLSYNDSALIYDNLAAVYNKSGQTDKAMTYWYQAFLLNSEQIAPRNCYKLAKALYKQGQIEQAINCHQQAIQTNPQFWASYYDLADIFTAQKDLGKAQKCLLQLLDQDANQIKAYYKLGMLYLKQNQPEQALVQFDKSIKIKPNFALAYREVIKIQMRTQQWEAAKISCEQFLKEIKNNPSWLYAYLANCYSKLGQTDQAKTYYQKVCELRGWLDCSLKDYYFTQDNFTFKIPIWTQYLNHLIAHRESQVLEIGSSQGMSICWLLNNILTDSSAQITCIDKAFSEIFLDNIAKTSAKERVKLLKGKASKLLANHQTNFFDLINVNDRSRNTGITEEDAMLYWQVLKEKGLIFFSKSPNREMTNNWQELAIQLSSFLKNIERHAKIFHYSHQIIIQKIKS